MPTVAEGGIPGFDTTSGTGSSRGENAAPARQHANREVVRVLKLPDIKERLLTQGATPAPTTPEEFDAFIRSEVKRFAKILIAAGAKIN